MRRALAVCVVGVLAGCGGTTSTAEWLEEMRSPDASRRLHAAKALGGKRSEAKTVVPALAEALKDPDAFVRREAARGLGDLGPEARGALPALQAALRDRKRDVRKAAADAVKKIDPEAASRAGVH